MSRQPHFRIAREPRAESPRGRTTHLVRVVPTSSAQAGRAVGRPRDDPSDTLVPVVPPLQRAGPDGVACSLRNKRSPRLQRMAI